MKKVDLNSDLGESFGRYHLGDDPAILTIVSSANIACGFHAGDPVTMANTVRLAEQLGVEIGAHPGLPDRVGFGRRVMMLSPEEAKADLKYQLGALMAFTKNNKVHHIKPHGALYNQAATDLTLAVALCEGVKEVDSEIIIYGLANSALIEAAKLLSLSYAQEVFADRHYNRDGSLVPRREAGALINDEQVIIDRVITMVKERRVQAIDGSWLALHPDTICLHGDHPKAIKLASRLAGALTNAGITIAPIRN
nr:5-oxoprolinase subunit PxpA [Amphibacillus marinus]